MPNDITGMSLAELYCTKNKKDASIAPRLKLDFDGERIQPDAALIEADVEDGDMIDVTVPDAHK